VTVNAVDANWEHCSNSFGSSGITLVGQHAGFGADANLSAGSGSFSVTLKTAGAANDNGHRSDRRKQDGEHDTFDNGTAGAFVKLQLLAPGETAARPECYWQGTGDSLH